jgi:hypothetical protein
MFFLLGLGAVRLCSRQAVILRRRKKQAKRTPKQASGLNVEAGPILTITSCINANWSKEQPFG